MAVPRLRVLATGALLALTYLATVAGVAQASLFLVFDRTSAPPGAVVHVRTGGNAGCTECQDVLVLYFADATAADLVTSLDDPALMRVGALTVDTLGNGVGAITVPDVPNGRYDVLAYCEPCAAASGGRPLLPVGPFPDSFRVNAGTTSSPASISMWMLVGLAIALLVGIAFGAAMVRRSIDARRAGESRT